MAFDFNDEPWRTAGELLYEFGTDGAIREINRQANYLIKAGLDADARSLSEVLTAVLTLGPWRNPHATLH